MGEEYFICRDRSGTVYLYFTEPWRDTVNGIFACGPGGCVRMPKDMPFDAVTWHNSPLRLKFEQVCEQVYTDPEPEVKKKKTSKKKETTVKKTFKKKEK